MNDNDLKNSTIIEGLSMELPNSYLWNGGIARNLSWLQITIYL